MVDTYTTALRARKIEQGAYSDTHGTRLNEDVFDLFDHAIAGTESINLGSSTTYALAALADGADSESRSMRLAFTGTPASAVTVTVPASVTSKLYVVDNDCGQTLTIKYAATSGVAVPDNERHLVLANGTTVFAIGAAIGAVQRNTYNIVGSVAGTNTITGSLSPTPNAYTAHMFCVLTPANTNTGATTLNLNSMGALDVQKFDGDALVAGDLLAGVPAFLILDSGADDWILLNPHQSHAYTQDTARAWVRFNGTGTLAIADSFNVSSVTDNNTGLYTVNFETALPNANYAALITANTNFNTLNNNAPTTAGFQIRTADITDTVSDASRVAAVVFGDA